MNYSICPILKSSNFMNITRRYISLSKLKSNCSLLMQERYTEFSFNNSHRSNHSLKTSLFQSRRHFACLPDPTALNCVQCRSCNKDLSSQPDHPCNPNNQQPEHSACKTCPAQLSPHRRLFCIHCGVIQPPNHVSFFELLGFGITFDIGSEELDVVVKNLQRRVHPDKFSMRPNEEQDFSSEHSSQINLAHSTLRDPLTRGRYILSLKAPELLREDNNIPTSMDLLMEVMEIREQIEECSTAKDYHTLLNIYTANEEKKSETIPLISNAFSKEDYLEMATSLNRLAYWYSIEADLRSIIPNETFEKYNIQPSKLTQS